MNTSNSVSTNQSQTVRESKLAMLGGLFRMFAASSYQQVVSNTTAVFIVQVILLAIGIFLTFKAYWPTRE